MFPPMLETWEQVLSFCRLSMTDDVLFHLVPVHNGLHSALNRPSILFIRNLTKKKTFFYGFDHPDVPSPKPIDHQQLIDALSSLSGTKWAVDKKSLYHMVPITGMLDIGFAQHLITNEVFEVSEFETAAHKLVRRNIPEGSGFGRAVPLVKHLETFSELVETCEKIIKKTSVDDSMKKFNQFIIEPLTETERHGLEVNPVVFKEHFGDILNNSTRVYTQYNYYTSTGRPSNRFGGINYAALNKEDGTRASFVSRYGSKGTLALIDYSAFHPRIIALLTDYPVPNWVDIYEYLARLYFNKQDVDHGDIADAKQITFRQLFGGVEQKYSHIKYLSHLKDFIDYHWRYFNEHGYVETPIFKRKITTKHLQTPKPATVFNYILQAVEGEISIPVLGRLHEFLAGKKTQPVLYTYDSILFDYHFEDETILADIREIMSLDGKFPTKVFVGDNYDEMAQVA